MLHTINRASAWGRETLPPGVPAWSSPGELQALVANGDLVENTTLLILNAGTVTGDPIRGEDAVRIVP